MTRVTEPHGRGATISPMSSPCPDGRPVARSSSFAADQFLGSQVSSERPNVAVPFQAPKPAWRLLALLIALTPSLHTQQLPRPTVVNVDHRGLPLQPSFDLHPSGRARFVWNIYNNHQERLMTTTLDRGSRAHAQELGPGAGVYWSPTLLADTDHSGWAVWQQQHGLEWRIAARRLRDDFWQPVEWLSEPGRNALTPAAATYDGELHVAWEDHAATPQRIVLRSAGHIAAISQPDKPCYRPALAATPDGLWALWDCYEGLHYSVYSRPVLPRIGPVEKLSGDRNAMDAAAAYGARAGLVADWVTDQDVMGKGALDQWHKVEAASRNGERWSSPQEIADLSHSLLSRIEPEVGPIWGFAGRRLHPMLVEDDGAVWLLWERKVEHDGR